MILPVLYHEAYVACSSPLTIGHDVYWGFSPVTPASVECFVLGHLPGLQRGYGRAVARSAVRLERLSAETPVLGLAVSV